MLHSSLNVCASAMTSGSASAVGRCDVVLGTRSRHLCASAQSGPDRAGRGAGEQLPVGKSAPLSYPGCGQIPLRPGSGAVLVLGSATPSSGKRLCRPDRDATSFFCCASATTNRQLPQVTIADLRQEVQAGQRRRHQRTAAAGVGAESSAGRAEHPLSQPAGQQPHAALR